MVKTGMKMAALLCLSLLSGASGGPCGVPNAPATLQPASVDEQPASVDEQPASVDEAVGPTDIELFCTDEGGQICVAHFDGKMVFCFFAAYKATFSPRVCMNHYLAHYTGLIIQNTNPMLFAQKFQTYCKDLEIPEGQYWGDLAQEQPGKCEIFNHTGAAESLSIVDCAEKHLTLCASRIE